MWIYVYVGTSKLPVYGPMVRVCQNKTLREKYGIVIIISDNRYREEYTEHEYGI
jgi:hypothetical protein